MFEGWRVRHESALRAIEVGDRPRELIHTLSEDLLGRFADLPLLSPYDVYQRLMEYWAEVMQDDVYLIAAEGWDVASRPRGLVEEKKRTIKETPDLVLQRKKYKMDLVPPALVIDRFLSEANAEIEELYARQEVASQALDALVEEHGGEDGILVEILSDKGKITRSAVKDRIKTIATEAADCEHCGDDPELERIVLERCLDLLEAESEAAKSAKERQNALQEDALKRYSMLAVHEIKVLVVDDKWMANLQAAISSELRHVTHQLAARIETLWERYSRPLPVLECELQRLSEKVDAHLSAMGLPRR